MKERERRLEHNCRIVFLILFILIITVTSIKTFLIGPKDKILKIENRKTIQPPAFTLETFSNGSYQEKLEESLADQMPASETIKTSYLLMKRELFKPLNFISKSNDNYHLISDQLYTYYDSDYLVRKFSNNIQRDKEEIIKSNDYYSNLPIKNKYYYLVTTDGAVDFNDSSRGELLAKEISSYFPDFKFDYLKIHNYEEYAKFYTKNDHHWSNKGAYQGYQDIISQILGKNEKILRPVEEITFNYDATGSKKRNAFPFVAEEKFSAYRFNIPEHKEYINNIKSIYGSQDAYFNDPELRNGTGELSYGDFYGFDYGVVEYDFNNKKKENLILIGFSDTNAINTLIASHFDKTWVIDTRFCDTETFNKILSENEIQNLLLVPNGNALYIPAIQDEPKGYE